MDLPNWVMVEACKGPEALVEFTLKNVRNPIDEVATSQFSIVVLNLD